MSKILENIIAIRNKKGLTQEYIAEWLKIEQPSYNLIENGKRKLKYETLEIIAKAMGIRTIDIIAYPDEIFLGKDLIAIDSKKDEIKATISIELKKEKKEQVLKLVFGENNLEILNK